MRPRNSLATLLAVAVLTACGPGPFEGLEPVPEPDLSNVSPQALALYREERSRLGDLLQRRDPADRALLVRTFGRLGKLAQAGERVEMAGACYRNAQRLDPEDPSWPYYLGQLQRFAGDWDRSVRSFERALALGPEDQATLIELAQMHLERDELGPAEELFQRAIRLGDPSSAATYGLGLVRLAQGSFAEAAKLFETTLERVPAASRVHYQLGVVYNRLGDRERAAAHMALQGPGLPRPADRLMDEVAELRTLIEHQEIPGAAAAAAGRTDDALAEVRAALAADPDDAVAALGLGTLLARRGEFPEAERRLRDALRLAADRRVAQDAGLNLGNLLRDTARDDEAVAQYRGVIELDPAAKAAEEARLQLVLTLVATGRAEDAEAEVRALLTAGPREPPLYLGLAESLGRQGRPALARWVLERGRDARPQDARIADALATLLATCPDDAVRDGVEALRLASSLFNAAKAGPQAVTLAMALAENGRFEDAARLQRIAVAEADRLGRPELADQLRGYLRLYENGHPVRLPPAAPEPR